MTQRRDLLRQDCFPMDILRLICSFLDDPKDVIHFGLANWHFSVLLSDKELWNSLVHKHFPSSCTESKLKAGALSLYKHRVDVAYNIKNGKSRLEAAYKLQDSFFCMTTWGDKLISCSLDRDIKIWDLRPIRKLHTLCGHQGWVSCLAIWGDKLVSSSTDGTMRIWDLNTALELWTFKKRYRNWIKCMTVWEDKLIFSSNGDKIIILDLNTGQKLETLKRYQPWINCMTILNDKLISSPTGGLIKILDLNTRQQICTFDSKDEINCMTILDDKLVCGLANGTIKIRDPHTGQELQALSGFRKRINCMAALDDDKLIFCSNDDAVQIWNFSSLPEQKRIQQKCLQS